MLRLKRLITEFSWHFLHRQTVKLLASIGFLAIAGNASSQTFAPPISTPFNFISPTNNFGAFDPELVDIDDDGDLDLFALSLDIAYYYENVGDASTPEFAAPVELPFGLVAVPIVNYKVGLAAVDIDDDGDFDLVAGEYYDGGFYFFENVGTAELPSFDAPTLNPFSLSPPYTYFYTGTHPDFVDIDDDGDFDLIAGEVYGEVKFYENVGTAQSPEFNYVDNPSFLSPIAQNQQLNELYPAFVDFDGDQDFDLFIASRNNPNFYEEVLWYYENIGTPSSPDFAAGQADPFNYTAPNLSSIWASRIDFGDMDNDGDPDLFVNYIPVAYAFYYFDNETEIASGLAEFDESDAENFKIMPNPGNGMLTVEFSSTSRGEKEVIVHNGLGEIVAQKTMKYDVNKQQIDLSNLPVGVYFIQIDGAGKRYVKTN